MIIIHQFYLHPFLSRSPCSLCSRGLSTDPLPILPATAPLGTSPVPYWATAARGRRDSPTLSLLINIIIQKLSFFFLMPGYMLSFILFLLQRILLQHIVTNYDHFFYYYLRIYYIIISASIDHYTVVDPFSLVFIQFLNNSN